MSEIMQGIYRQEGQPDRPVCIQVDADGRMVVAGGVGGGSVDALTDTQLRATAVPISGTVTAQTGLSQPLTDAQLRAAAVPIQASWPRGLMSISSSWAAGSVEGVAGADAPGVGVVMVCSLWFR